MQRNSDVIGQMRKILSINQLVAMTKVLAEMKSNKEITPQLQNIKLLFFGAQKDVKVDKEYLAKRKCLESLRTTLPVSK